MRPPLVVASIAAALVANADVSAAAAGTSSSPNPVVLVDSTGNAVGGPLGETLALVTVGSGVVAPAAIRPIYDVDGRVTSGLATWQAGGSVLFTSSDCTAGAHVHSLTHAGVRATTQVQTPAGIMLYVGSVGVASTVAIHSILYDTGCAPVTVHANGLLPVVTIRNLSTAYPPPLAFQ